MTVSPAKGTARRCAVAGVCALAMLVPGFAMAQLQLRRPTPAVTPTPDQTAPVAVEKPQADQADPPAVRPRSGITVAPRPFDGSSIVVNTLETVDPDAIGLIGEDQGGFPLGLWQGTEWPLVRALMQRMPAATSSLAIRDLAKRLLMSRASVPAGKPLDASFVALRVDRLLAMGDIGNALALLKIAPDARRDENLLRTRIEALFFDNNNSDACKAVRAAVSDYSGMYWSQAQAFCFALSGEHARASLIADLLRERENEIEPVFFSAVDALAGSRGGESPSLKAPLALHLAMMRSVGLQFTAEIAQTGNVAVLRAVALAPNAALDIRLIAAERAHRLGALTGGEIIRLYRGFPFSKDELNSPISTAEESWAPRTRALLIRAAAEQTVALAKAEVLRRAWELGREREGYAEIAGASMPIVMSIDPAAELIWFARDAARVLFAGGGTDRALAWYATALADRERIDEARTAEAALWPLAVLADTQDAVPFDPARLRQWYAARRQADPQSAPAHALAFYALLEVTGRILPPQIWRDLLDGPFAAGSGRTGGTLNMAWAQSLAAASSDGRIGETILLATVGAGDAGDGGLSVADAGRVIAALRRLRLETEARRLAVEAAMAAGL